MCVLLDLALVFSPDSDRDESVAKGGSKDDLAACCDSNSSLI